MKAPGNGLIPLPDFSELILKGFAVTFQRMAEIEKIGDLLIFRGAPAGGAGDQVTAGRLQFENTADLAELFIAGQRAAAEFGYDTFKHGIPSICSVFDASIKHQLIF